MGPTWYRLGPQQRCYLVSCLVLVSMSRFVPHVSAARLYSKKSNSEFTLLPAHYDTVQRSEVQFEPMAASIVSDRQRRSENMKPSSRASDSLPVMASSMHLSLPISKRRTVLKLIENRGLFAEGFEAISIDENGEATQIVPNRSQFFAGVVYGAEQTSHVRMHRSEEGLWTGTIALQNRIYMIEPATHYGLDHDMIIYEHSNLPKFDNSSGSCGVHSDHFTHDATLNRNRRVTVPELGYTKCPLLMVADSTYVRSVGSVAAATEFLLLAASFVDKVLQGTEIGEQAYGVSVRKVVVYSDAVTDPYGGEMSEPEQLLNIFATPQMDGRVDHHNYCLAHLFTSRTLDGGVQGLAWVGRPSSNSAGICSGFGQPSLSEFLNTGFTTNENSGSRTPTLTQYLVMAHELGHNYGSVHDGDVESSDSSCSPDDAAGGKYIMHPISVSGEFPNNLLFSNCSAAAMGRVVQNWGGKCFTPVAASVCGDGIVDPAGADGNISTTDDNEECDSGNRAEGDFCCDTQCKLRDGAVCSDANSACCDTCQIATISKFCYLGFENDVHCKKTTYCDGVNVSCPAIEQKPAGTSCGEKGYCVPSHNESERCIHWCTQFGARKCTCTDIPQSCSVCCVNDPAVHPYCDPSSVYNESLGLCVNTTDDSTFEGTRPFGSTCTPPESIIFNSHFVDSTGSTLSQEDGYLNELSSCPIGKCDAAGSCIPQNDDTITDIWADLSALTPEGLWNWAKANIAGAILLFTGIPWFIGSVFMCRRDKSKRATLQNKYLNLVVPDRDLNKKGKKRKT